MCGRFTLKTAVGELAERFGLPERPDLEPRYNIAPTQPVATVLVLTGEREFRLMRWGLVPPWAKDLSVGSRMINARAETVAEKPAFRSALRARRCLIMADGFYEWQRTGTVKQPYYVAMADGRPFAFAGLWERWQGSPKAGESALGTPSPPGGGEAVESCTIITTDANQLVAAFHERMPVILDAEAFELWLDPAVTDPARVLPLLRPYPAGKMLAWPVSTAVNRPGHESGELIKPAPPADGQ